MKPLRFVMNEEFLNSDFSKPMDGFDELLKLSNSARIDLFEENHIDSLPILTKDQEAYLFRQFNYLKYLYNLYLERNKKANKSLEQEIKDLQTVLYNCNIRLIISYLSRYKLSPQVFMDRFSEAAEVLLKSVTLFDYSLKWKFSTYCMTALFRAFSRIIAIEYKKKAFAVSSMENEELDLLTNTPVYSEDNDDTDIYKIFKMANLTEAEIDILVNNLGLFNDKPVSMSILGKSYLKISRERVRQLKVRALGKLRKYINPESLRVS